MPSSSSKFSNWPASRPTDQPSSRSENDESLLPSRLAREKITPRIPRELAQRARDFCRIEGISLQDAVAEGLELLMQAFVRDRGRPAVQPSSRPLINDQEIKDLITDIEIDVDQTSQNQTSDQIFSELAKMLRPETFEIWIKPLSFVVNETAGRVVISSPNQVLVEWLSKNHNNQIQQALANIGLAGYALEWESDEEEEPRAAPPQRPTAGDQASDLLAFYSIVTENPLREKDRSSFQKIAHCSPDSVRSGILRSRLKAKTRVNSFEYCVKPILQIEQAGLGPVLLGALQDEFARQPLLPGAGAQIIDLHRKENPE